MINLLLLFNSDVVYGQTTADRVIRLTATVQEVPAQIKLSWRPLFLSPSADTSWVYIHRKTKTALVWDTLATVSATDTSFTDEMVIADAAYEYYLLKAELSVDTYYIPEPPPGCVRCQPGPDTVVNSNISVHEKGYIYAGIRAPAIHTRGTLLLLADTVFTDSCAAEIQQLTDDIIGDGWNIVRYDISRTASDTEVRALIRKEYLSVRAGITAVLLLGHIAVPYSGDLAPDGHPNHRGAWPADIYYGDVYSTAADTFWTDFQVNSTMASRPQNRNIPGDGKWDQSRIFTPAGMQRLQVSRIDFYDMPAFNKTEVQLMRSYLERNHAYKTGVLDICRRALIDDNFPQWFSTCGWRNFSPLVGSENIHTADFIPALNDSSFQWAYGCGAGTYTSAGGIGTTADFAGNDVNGIFTMLYGSYFGDWDSHNNFLRAPLCAPTPALTSCWAAGGSRVDWYFHHMALGEHIGYSAMLAQAKRLEYYRSDSAENSFGQTIERALMGDLTLRTDYIAQPSNLVFSGDCPGGVQLSWDASPDTAVIGYYVYRSGTRHGNYQRISALLPSVTYHDSGSVCGQKHYMVRPVKQEVTPSGTYYNLGIGVLNTIPDSGSRPALSAGETGTRSVITLYPNPVSGMLYLTVHSNGGSARFDIMDQHGRVVHTATHVLVKGVRTIPFSLQYLPPALYLIRMNTADGIWAKPFIRQD